MIRVRGGMGGDDKGNGEGSGVATATVAGDDAAAAAAAAADVDELDDADIDGGPIDPRCVCCVDV